MSNIESTKDGLVEISSGRKIVSPMDEIPYPFIKVNSADPKKTFDEIALSRCSVMAHESLNPDEFDAFVKVHNILIQRRKLQNRVIT